MIKLRIIVLAALLLLCQSGMLLHELDAEHFDSGHSQCEICLSENGLDSAFGVSASSVAIPFSNTNTFIAFAPLVLSQANTLYQSRAPPRA